MIEVGLDCDSQAFSKETPNLLTYSTSVILAQ